MKSYSVSISSIANTAAFSFDMSNVSNPTLVYLWCYVDATDLTLGKPVTDPTCFVTLGANNLVTPVNNVLQNVTQFTGTMASNGKYVIASSLLPWVGELVMPSTVLRLDFTCRIASGNSLGCTFYGQFAFAS